MSASNSQPSPRLAPVITIAERRAARNVPRRAPVGDGLRGLALAFMFGIGVAISLAGIGLLASVALRHALIVLPVVAAFAALLVWPATIRRLAPSAAVPAPAGRPAVRRGRAQVLQHPAARIDRGSL